MSVEALESRAMLSAVPLEISPEFAHASPYEAEVAEQRAFDPVAAHAGDRVVPLIRTIQAFRAQDDQANPSPGGNSETAESRCCFHVSLTRINAVRANHTIPVGFAVTVRRPLLFVSPASALASHRADVHRVALDHLIGEWQWNHEPADHDAGHQNHSGYTGISHAFASTKEHQPGIDLSESPLAGAEGEPPDPLPPVDRPGNGDGGFVDLIVNETPAVMRYDSQTGMEASLSLMHNANATAVPSVAEPAEAMSSTQDAPLGETRRSQSDPSDARFAGQDAGTATPNESSSATSMDNDLQAPMPTVPADEQIVDGIVTRLFDGDLSRFLDSRGQESWQLELDRLGVAPDTLPQPQHEDLPPVPEAAAGTGDVATVNSDEVSERTVEQAELSDGGAVDLMSFDQLAATTMANQPASLVPEVAPLTIDARLGFYRSIELASAGEDTVPRATETAAVSTHEAPIVPVDQVAKTTAPAGWNPRQWSRWATAALVTGFVWAIRQPRETRSNQQPTRGFLDRVRRRRRDRIR